MPRTTQDFSPIDVGAQVNISYGLGPQGGFNRPLAVGERITSVAFQIFLISGIDPTPSATLLGAPVVQPDGITVTQQVLGRIGGAVYLILATPTTTSGQVLPVYSHLPVNAIS
jgi:hypothetical protein